MKHSSLTIVLLMLAASAHAQHSKPATQTPPEPATVQPRTTQAPPRNPRETTGFVFTQKPRYISLADIPAMFPPPRQ